jgi:hypothetical protein
LRNWKKSVLEKWRNNYAIDKNSISKSDFNAAVMIGGGKFIGEINGPKKSNMDFRLRKQYRNLMNKAQRARHSCINKWEVKLATEFEKPEVGAP